MSEKADGTAPQMNIPIVAKEAAALCDAYEAALMANNLDALDRLFRSSPNVACYGVNENPIGIMQIRHFRQKRTSGSPQRDARRRTIAAFGNDFTASNLEFVRSATGARGRPSRTWIKIPDGWRIEARASQMNVDR